MHPALWCAFGIGLLSSSVQADVFKAKWIEINLPAGWSCVQKRGVEWVCASHDKSAAHDAYWVLAAKPKETEDTLESYRDKLRQSRVSLGAGGKRVTTEPSYVKELELGGAKWVDVLHTDSELRGYLTRYVATVLPDLGVVVTYTILKAKYTQYSTQFDQILMGMKVTNVKDPNEAPPLASNLTVGLPTAALTPLPQAVKAVPVAGVGGDGSAGGGLGLLALGAVGVGIYLYRKKRGQVP
ncbi:MAG: hypothetical protein HY074_01700 [Deltaproteobacteria bacterium]|nr:hypothetical protein [Deltaproteobacteria bacterium]